MSALRRIAGLVALSLLAACGNKSDEGLLLKAVGSAFLPGKAAGKAGSAPSAEQVLAAVQAALAATDQPVALLASEKSGSAAILTRIEQNGAYETWATPDRRSFTMKGGVVTATRGLGHDLMSSDIDAALGLIRRRAAGEAGRVMRYLDGENHTVELVLQCRIARGGRQAISAGELKNVVTTTMTESCRAEETAFTNSYLVDGNGRIVQSLQWLSPASGSVIIQRLR